MFIASKNHILIPGAEGQDAVRIPRGFVGEIPDWVGGTAYFKDLVKCGKITLSGGGRGKKGRNSSSRPGKSGRTGGGGRDETPPEKPGEAG